MAISETQKSSESLKTHQTISSTKDLLDPQVTDTSNAPQSTQPSSHKQKTHKVTPQKKSASQMEKERILSVFDAEDKNIQDNPGLFHKVSEDSDTFNHLLETHYKNDFSQGDVVQGVVIDVQKDFVLVDINYKSEGLIPISEFQSEKDNQKNQTIDIGSQIEVYIEHLENENGMVVLSKIKADMLQAWKEVSKAAENQETVEGTVIAKVKGGLSIDIGVKAFLPGSQIDLRPVKSLDDYVGKTLQFKIIKFNKKRGNIVLSRRALLAEDRDQLKMQYKTAENIKIGDVVTGVIKNITDYGAFIGLGGLDGLLHITDMSWKRIKHPSEVLEVGNRIEVKVLKYDEKSGRVSLGLKQLQPDPWSGVAESISTGSKTRGRIMSLADYGAFVTLKDGIEGLIHISEMSWTKRIKHPSECVSVGEEVDVVVLDVDSEHRRISLGIKQLKANPWEELKKIYEPGTIVQGEVKSVTDFGIFIGVEENIDGLVHISDFSWTKRIHHPSEIFKKGDSVKAVVLGLDVEHERFSLGIKQLESDPWLDIDESFAIGSQHKVKVVKIVDFGVFVELTSNLEGLIHISELPKPRSEKIEDYLKIGDQLQAVVVSIDKKARKIALSAKLDQSNNSDDSKKSSVTDDKIKPTEKTSLGDIFSETLKQAKDKTATYKASPKSIDKQVTFNDENEEEEVKK